MIHPPKTSTKSVTIIKPRGILSKVDRKVKRDGVSRLGASRVIAGKETARGTQLRDSKEDRRAGTVKFLSLKLSSQVLRRGF